MSEKQNNVEQEQRKVYSYHTFIFPFLLHGVGIRKKLIDAVSTVPDKWTDECADPEKDATDSLRYNQHQYFYPAARQVIYPSKEKNAPLRSFRYLPCGDSSEKWEYVIDKGGEKCLDVSSIRLKLFNTDVGMLVFDLENSRYPEERDVIRINEFGRRLFMPFVFGKDGGCSLCADRIYLRCQKNGTTETVGMETITGSYRSYQEPNYAPLITELLSFGSRRAVFRDADGDGEFLIEPIVDDRMFVACYYINAALADTLSARTEDGEYRYLADALRKRPDEEDNASRRLYETVFIDGTGITCCNRQMLDAFMRKNIYARWIENYFGSSKSGSVTGITDYSMVTVTASDADHLINAFRTEYTELAMLVLAQRASLLAFQNGISDCADNKNDEADLHRKYVLFQSQFLLSEVTAQQQGIELYDMLREKAFIREREKNVGARLKELFEERQLKSEEKENRLLFIISLLAVFEAMEILFTGGYALFGGSPGSAPSVGVIASFILIAVLFVIFSCMNKKRK